MKIKLLSLPNFLQFILHNIFFLKNSSNLLEFKKLQFFLILFFIYTSSLIAQAPHTFTASGTFIAPAGVPANVSVQAWGAGGAGGGAIAHTGPLSSVIATGGGGGGGGAYAINNITFVGGSTYNITVGPQNLGTTGNGGNGGNSTIVEFNTTILAAGGKGGVANGGTFGLGGANTDSFGTTRTSGSNGAAGGEGLATIAVGSGGGGNGANPNVANPGTGGGGIVGIVGANIDGNPGLVRGGAGGGAVASSLTVARTGGAGARGEVILTYTCPTYSISTLTPGAVCTGSSLVAVSTTPAASLPAGTYTVSYTRSNPAGSDTATMTVSPAGTGSFTATGFTNVGTSTITVTNIASGSVTIGASPAIAACSNAVNVSATVTINPLPQGSLTAVSPLCGSLNPGQLTFTASAGTGPYTVVYKENGGADRTATGVVSGTAFAPFTTPVTASTTYTLVSVTDINCIRNTGFTGGTATITVNPLPQGSLTANGPFCVTGAGQLTFTASIGTGPYTVVYKENGGADRTATGVVSGTAFNVFTTPVTTSTTYTLVSVTDVNCIRNTGFTSGTATITVNPLPQGSLNAVSPLCGSGAGQLTFTASTGTGPYTVVYKENGGADRTATGVVSGTAFTPFTTPVTASTTYTLVSVTGSNSCIRNASFTGGSATITVNPLPQGSLTAVSPLCGSGAGQLTFTASIGTGPYTVVYKENGGADRTATGVVSGTAFTPFTTPVTASTTYTLVSVTDANCIRNTGFTGGTATITVNPLPQGSLTAVSPLCGSGAGQLTFTASTGTGPYTVVYKENGGADRTATGVVSGTAFTPFTTPVTASTTYTLVSVTGSNSCIRNASFTGGSATITVNPLPQGSLTAVSPLCGSGAGQLTFTASTGTGPYTVVYKENGGADRTATGVVSGTAFAPFTSPVTASTTYTLVSVTDANCIRNTGYTGGTATITVNPLPQGSLSAVSPLCGSGPGQLTFTASIGTGPYTVVYKENGGADRTATGVVSGTAFAPFTTPVTASTTYTLVSVTDANCIRNTGFTGGTATITVNPLPQGSLTAVSPLCGSGTGQLTFTASIGTGPYTVVYKENGGADRTATGVVSGTAFAPFTTPVTASTTYTLVSVTDANCVRNTGFTGGTATITVNPLPQGSLSAVSPLCGSGAGQLTFTASIGTGPYTVVYKENGGADRTATGVVSGTAFAPFTSPVTAFTTYTLVSVTDANCIRNSGFTGGTATITVNPLPQGSLSAVSPLCGSGAGQLTFTASIGTGPYTVVYKENGGADRTATGVVSGTAFAPFTTPVTASTTYTLVSVADANCIRNTGFTGGTATITVNPLPSVTLSAVTPVCTSAGAQNATLNYTNATAAPTTYSITWNASPSNSFAPVTDAALGASITIPVPGGTLPQTYTGALTVKNLNGCVSSPTNFTVTVNPLPSTPVPGAVVEPTCVTSTGSVALSGLIGSGTWTITQTGTASNTYTGTGTSYTVSNLTPGTYYFSIQQGTDCSSLLTTGVVINSVSINTWNGTAWSKGTPPVSTDAIVFSGNYTTSGDLSGCSLTVNSGVTVTVNSTHTLTITNSVSNGGGTLIFENSSSLYQTSNAVNTGNIIYKRIAMAVRRYDLTQWSSPVTRTPIYTLHDLSPNTLADKYYKYNSSAGAWVVNFNGTDEMLKGIGYSVRGPQYSDIDIPAPYYAEFEGVPNNGPVPVALGGADKWNLLGNPYPSAVYADQFIVDNQTNLYGALYFWTHNSKPVGNGGGGSSYVNDDYAIYNLAGSTTIGGLTGTGAGTPGNQDPPLGYIGAGQAFFVKSKTGSNASFTNSMRVPGNNSQFYKTENSSNKAEIEKHRIWLNLSNTEGAFKQLLIAYISGATNSWDNNYDAVTLDGNKYLDFYSIDAKRKLVIQGRAVPFDESDTVPLGYRSSIAGKFTISIDEVDGNLTVQPIYLEDKITGVLHDLKASDYTFTTAIGTFADRFVLKYFNAALGTDEFEDNKNKVLVSVKNKIIKLTSGSNTENLNQVVIFDVSGKVIYEKKKIGTTELEIINLKSGNEVLIVKTTLENGFTTSSKIVFY